MKSETRFERRKEEAPRTKHNFIQKYTQPTHIRPTLCGNDSDKKSDKKFLSMCAKIEMKTSATRFGGEIKSLTNKLCKVFAQPKPGRAGRCGQIGKIYKQNACTCAPVHGTVGTVCNYNTPEGRVVPGRCA